MKISKKDLNYIILKELKEDILNERLGAISYDYKPPSCDFDFDPDFLQFLEIMKAGGKIPKGLHNSEKPNWLNPLFISSIKNSFLPFMNLLVAPTFGIRSQCDMLRKLQGAFLRMNREYQSGLMRQEDYNTDDTTTGNTTTTSTISYEKYFLELKNIFRSERVSVHADRKSNFIDRPPSGFSKEEMKLASMIFGPLDEAGGTGINKRTVNQIVDKYRGLTSLTFVNDLVYPASYGASISGYQEDKLKKLLSKSIKLWSSDNEGLNKILQYINKLIRKLQNEGILTP